MLDTSTNLPATEANDVADVIAALQTARELWTKGQALESVRWIQRAAENAEEAGNDLRAVSLARAAADLRAEVSASSVPPRPVTEPAPLPPYDEFTESTIVDSPASSLSRVAMQNNVHIAELKPSSRPPVITPAGAPVPAVAAPPPPPPPPPLAPPSAAVPAVPAAPPAPVPTDTRAVGAASPTPAGPLMPPPPPIAAAPAMPVVPVTPVVSVKATLPGAAAAPVTSAAPAPPAMAAAPPPTAAATSAAPMVSAAPVPATAPAAASPVRSVTAAQHQTLRVCVIGAGTGARELSVRVLNEGETAPAGAIEALLVSLDSKARLL